MKCKICGYKFKTTEQEITSNKEKENPELCAICENKNKSK